MAKQGDWETAFLNPKNYPHLTYQIAFTEKNLYFCIRILDQQTQMQAIQYGLSVWVDTTHKQHHRTGLHYPLSLTDAQLQHLSTLSPDKNNKTGLEKAYSELCQEFEIVGFAPEPLRMTNVGSQNFKAAVGFDELGALVCEYQIAWKVIYPHIPRWNELLTLGIRVNDPPKNPSTDTDDGNTLVNSSQMRNPLFPNQQGGGSNPNNPMGGTGGNPMGGTGGNPMGNPNGAPTGTSVRPSTPQMPHVWVKFQLTKVATEK